MHHQHHHHLSPFARHLRNYILQHGFIVDDEFVYLMLETFSTFNAMEFIFIAKKSLVAHKENFSR